MKVLTKQKSESKNQVPLWLSRKLETSGMSVERFANRCGLSRAAVYFFLAGDSRPSESTMRRMCAVLGVSAEEGLAQYVPNR